MNKRLAVLVAAAVILVVFVLLGQRLLAAEAEGSKLTSIAAVPGRPGAVPCVTSSTVLVTAGVCWP